jgi:hypothetical protein
MELRWGFAKSWHETSVLDKIWVSPLVFVLRTRTPLPARCTSGNPAAPQEPLERKRRPVFYSSKGFSSSSGFLVHLGHQIGSGQSSTDALKSVWQRRHRSQRKGTAAAAGRVGRLLRHHRWKARIRSHILSDVMSARADCSRSLCSLQSS